jgi:hypothetical protein
MLYRNKKRKANENILFTGAESSIFELMIYLKAKWLLSKVIVFRS